MEVLDLINSRPADGDDEVPAAVREVRTLAARAVEAARHGGTPAPADVDRLNAIMRAAPAYPVLDGRTLTRARDGSPAQQAAARLAEATAELLASPSVTAIKQCAAPDCIQLFLPANPRRQWCSAARCGNRARVARYYQRHRTV
ncbi:CGNR zinc finger domain-containing protein [Dactylosporangium sp. NPDC049140]|uniref:CGNR zinc finger domain-containing protein n=1 Tax=Dactylosporangium sp. NPDC049140 TaxID=3155647 RepID=UPI0033CA42EA